MLKTTAIAHFGSQQKLADALGIRQPCVSRWKVAVPIGRAYQLQVITAGLLQVDRSLYPALADRDPKVCPLPSPSQGV